MIRAAAKGVPRSRLPNLLPQTLTKSPKNQRALKIWNGARRQQRTKNIANIAGETSVNNTTNVAGGAVGAHLEHLKPSNAVHLEPLKPSTADYWRNKLNNPGTENLKKGNALYNVALARSLTNKIAKKQRQRREPAKSRRMSCVGSYLQSERGMVRNLDERRADLTRKLKGRFKSLDLKHIFRSWDTDASGCLNRQEVRAGINRLGFSLIQDDLDFVFDEMDVDGDGVIVVDEFMAFTQASWAEADAPDTAKMQYYSNLKKMREEEFFAKETSNKATLTTLRQQKDSARSRGAVSAKYPAGSAEARVRGMLNARDMRYEKKKLNTMLQRKLKKKEAAG
jgi:hypothetical protein